MVLALCEWLSCVSHIKKVGTKFPKTDKDGETLERKKDEKQPTKYKSGGIILIF